VDDVRHSEFKILDLRFTIWGPNGKIRRFLSSDWQIFPLNMAQLGAFPAKKSKILNLKSQIIKNTLHLQPLKTGRDPNFKN
jgi:hypothetical protein